MVDIGPERPEYHAPKRWAEFNLPETGETFTDTAVVHLASPRAGESFDGHMVFRITLVDDTPIVSFVKLSGTCDIEP